jgi:AcrR family transcriptional regulator
LTKIKLTGQSVYLRETMTEHHCESDRRKQILDAALLLFTERGFEETTVEQIARTAGLSKGAVYWYFKSKLELLFTLADNFIQDSVRMLDGLARGYEAGPEAIYLVHRTLYNERLAKPIYAKLLHQLETLGGWYPEIRERLDRYNQMWDDTSTKLINEAIEAGQFRTVDSRLVAQAISAMYHGLAMRHELNPEIDVVTCLEAATRLFYEALIIRPSLGGQPADAI